MNSPKEDKRTGFILMGLGVIPVVWAALMVAPFLSEGLAGIVEGFTSGMRNPMKVTWCADSLKAICIFLVIYGMSLGMYYSTRRNYRKGEEHGSAKWGDPRQICRKYAEKDKGQNVICIFRNEHTIAQYVLKKFVTRILRSSVDNIYRCFFL